MQQTEFKEYLKKQVLFEVQAYKLRTTLTEDEKGAAAFYLIEQHGRLDEGILDSIKSVVGGGTKEVKRFMLSRLVSYLGIPKDNMLREPIMKELSSLSLKELADLSKGDVGLRKRFVDVLTKATIEAFSKNMDKMLKVKDTSRLGQPLISSLRTVVNKPEFKNSVKQAYEDSFVDLGKSDFADMQSIKKQLDDIQATLTGNKQPAITPPPAEAGTSPRTLTVRDMPNYRDIVKAVKNMTGTVTQRKIEYEFGLKAVAASKLIDTLVEDNILEPVARGEWQVSETDTTPRKVVAPQTVKRKQTAEEPKEKPVSIPVPPVSATNDEKVKAAENAAKVATKAAQQAEAGEKNVDEDVVEAAADTAEEAVSTAKEISNEIDEPKAKQKAVSSVEDAIKQEEKAKNAALRMPIVNFMKEKMKQDFKPIGQYSARIGGDKLQQIHDSFLAAETDQQRLQAIKDFITPVAYERINSSIAMGTPESVPVADVTSQLQANVPTNPLKADSDGDGLSDGEETKIGTNPNNPDTDGDGLSDGEEVAPVALKDKKKGQSNTQPQTEEKLQNSNKVVKNLPATSKALQKEFIDVTEPITAFVNSINPDIGDIEDYMNPATKLRDVPSIVANFVSKEGKREKLEALQGHLRGRAYNSLKDAMSPPGVEQGQSTSTEPEIIKKPTEEYKPFIPTEPTKKVKQDDIDKGIDFFDKVMMGQIRNKTEEQIQKIQARGDELISSLQDGKISLDDFKKQVNNIFGLGKAAPRLKEDMYESVHLPDDFLKLLFE